MTSSALPRIDVGDTPAPPRDADLPASIPSPIRRRAGTRLRVAPRAVGPGGLVAARTLGQLSARRRRVVGCRRTRLHAIPQEPLDDVRHLDRRRARGAAPVSSGAALCPADGGLARASGLAPTRPSSASCTRCCSVPFRTRRRQSWSASGATTRVSRSPPIRSRRPTTKPSGPAHRSRASRRCTPS